jgi:hypothetical protein
MKGGCATATRMNSSTSTSYVVVVSVVDYELL